MENRSDSMHSPDIIFAIWTPASSKGEISTGSPESGCLQFFWAEKVVCEIMDCWADRQCAKLNLLNCDCWNKNRIQYPLGNNIFFPPFIPNKQPENSGPDRFFSSFLMNFLLSLWVFLSLLRQGFSSFSPLIPPTHCGSPLCPWRRLHLYRAPVIMSV